MSDLFGLLTSLFQTIRFDGTPNGDLDQTDSLSSELQEILRRRRYGIIETAAGRVVAIRYRPWPYSASRLGALWDRHVCHRLRPGNRCWFSFNHPRCANDYLAGIYVVSTSHASLATFRAAVRALDAIARLKQCQAIVVEATNSRISDRLLSRWGWRQHLLSSGQRHFIKRLPLKDEVATRDNAPAECAARALASASSPVGMLNCHCDAQEAPLPSAAV